MRKPLLELTAVAAISVGLYCGWQSLVPGSGVAPSQSLPATANLQASSAAEAMTVVPQLPAAKAALATPVHDGFSAADVAVMQKLQAHFATGDFVTALRLADQHTEGDDGSPAFQQWLRAQMPVLLTSAGWSRLKLGDCDEATQFLRRAEVLKRTPETAKGLAVCYYKQKNLAAAREQFSAYMEKSPGDLQMQMLFTDVLESEGNFDEAVRILEQVAERSQTAGDQAANIDAESLKQRLESMRARAKESVFQTYENSRNFRLAYRAGDHEDLVSFVLTTLEDALDEYVESYGFKLPPSQIEVVLYPEGNFRGIVAGGPEWAEGLFDGRLRIPVREEAVTQRRYGSLPKVLRHELVHALFALMSDSRSIPSWFDEGMAQRLSCPSGGCGRFQFPPRPGQFLAESAFFSPYISFNAQKAGRAYQQSLFLIDVLEAQDDGALRQLVTHVTTSSDLSSDGLLKPLGTTFADLHRRASGYWSARSAPSGR